MGVRESSSPAPTTWQLMTRPHVIFFLLPLAVTVYTAIFVVVALRSDELSMRNSKPEVFGLYRGWFLGRFVDLKDLQWRSFREQMPLLLVSIPLHLYFSSWATKTFGTKGRLGSTALVSASLFILLFGIYSVHMAAVCSASFVLTRVVPSHMCVIMVWVLVISVLLVNEWTQGLSAAYFMGNAYLWLEEWPYGGLLRWNLAFKFVLLRLVSHASDRFYELHDGNGIQADTLATHGLCNDCTSSGECLRERESTHRPREEYESALMFFSYVFYAPLLVAGPICSFNSWASHLHRPQATHDRRALAFLAARFVANIVFLEILLHTVYCFSIAKAGTWRMFRPLQHGGYCLLSLHLMYQKFLVMWSLFRLWALLDGIETYANLSRCIVDCTGIEDFWKHWHRSFNKWLVRYLYIPLGGNRKGFLRKYFNAVIVFVFVAIWHDVHNQLGVWAGVILVFLLFEGLAIRLISMLQYVPTLYRFSRILLTTVTMIGLIVANVAGFLGGTTELRWLVREFSEENFPEDVIVAFVLVGLNAWFIHDLREWQQERASMSRVGKSV